MEKHLVQVIDVEAPPSGLREPQQLVLDLDGFEGPIDLLLALARDQKVDLTQISILALADQYLAYIESVRQLRLELASDYLVMAAWLAYLKSRLLLPRLDGDEEPDPEFLAQTLALQLRRLEAMREAGERLFARDLLGRDVFARGNAEGITAISRIFYSPSLHDLVRAYADLRRRGHLSTMSIEPSEIYSVEQALRRLATMVGQNLDWINLQSFLPVDIADGLIARSALASTFAASLELAREGKIEMQQAGTFGPIYLRRRPVEI